MGLGSLNLGNPNGTQVFRDGLKQLDLSISGKSDRSSRCIPPEEGYVRERSGIMAVSMGHVRLGEVSWGTVLDWQAQPRPRHHHRRAHLGDVLERLSMAAIIETEEKV